MSQPAHSPDLKQPIAVLGAGSWGTALALLLARNGNPTRLWGHLPDAMHQMRTDRNNARYLPDHPFPENLTPCIEMDEALADCQDILVVVPSHAFGDTLKQLQRPQDSIRLAWATKGLEPGSARFLDQVADEILGSETPKAVISGPSFAGEVAAGQPTAVTVASHSDAFAQDWVNRLACDCFRAYTSHDVIGVQLGGAVKNVLAIASGIAAGLGLGANARSALITRGLAEMMRLGAALGSERETLMGLAGLGDLILTCTDNQSRNRRFGLALADGKGTEEAVTEIGQVVEGIQTAREIWRLAQQHQVEMPITEQTYKVLYENLSPKAAVQALLSREQKAEIG